MQCDYPYPCSRSIGPFPIEYDALCAECLHLGWKYALEQQVQVEGARVWLVAWVIKPSQLLLLPLIMLPYYLDLPYMEYAVG
jgi:hypothetical protein